MRKIQLFLEKLYERKIKREFDRIIPIIADEGYGKSTLILQLCVLWNDILEEGDDPEVLIDRMVWTREEYKTALTEYPKRSVIPVPDAGRILYKKDAMVGKQKEIEKDMLQSRVQENLVLLGFQDWDIIPRQLQSRRAKNIFRITSRGKVVGYNRKSIDERYKEGEWPDPDLEDTFPSLEGTDIWKKYKEIDRQKKIELMSIDDEEEQEQEMTVKEMAEDIVESEVTEFVSKHPQNGKLYVDGDLIEVEYGVSARKAKKVKKFVAKKVDLEELKPRMA